jgi:hypothetical protein
MDASIGWSSYGTTLSSAELRHVYEYVDVNLESHLGKDALGNR